MSAVQYDFSIEQGSSYKLKIKYKDNKNKVVPLDDYCARLTILTNNQIVKVFSTTDAANEDYKFYIDEPNGMVILLLSAHYTNSLDFTSAKYDLEMQSPRDLYAEGGKYTFRILYGNISIIKRFTKTNNMLDCIT
jgi:hypothetical protein